MAGTLYNGIEDKRVCRKRNNGEEIGLGAKVSPFYTGVKVP
jgi:hypothetical protein